MHGSAFLCVAGNGPTYTGRTIPPQRLAPAVAHTVTSRQRARCCALRTSALSGTIRIAATARSQQGIFPTISRMKRPCV